MQYVRFNQAFRRVDLVATGMFDLVEVYSLGTCMYSRQHKRYNVGPMTHSA
jgi:hypothetical protein